MRSIVAFYCVLFVVVAPLVLYFSWPLYGDEEFVNGLLSAAHAVIADAVILAVLVQILTSRNERKLYLEGKLAELRVYCSKPRPEHVVAIELVIREIFRIGYPKQLNLTEARLDSIDLHSLNGLSGASLNCKSSQMRQAQLSECRLVNCEFSGAELYKASFRGATLVNCDFCDTDLTDVDWSDVSIENSDLGSSKHLNVEKLNAESRSIDKKSAAALEVLQATYNRGINPGQA